MQEIVDQVLKAEQEAETRIQAAREQAAHKRSLLEAECTERLAAAKQEAQALVMTAVTEAREQADREHREALARAGESGAAFVESRRGQLDRIARELADLVVQPGMKG